MSGAFVGLDGRQAEVWVQTGTGTIVALDDSREKTAYVTVHGRKSDGTPLKHKTHGWIPKSDPLFEKVKEAFDQKRDVEYRIESQRKPSIDPSLPIQPLRETMDLAKDNTIQIFAGLDGVLSGEAVTNPKHDAVGGRVRASDDAPAKSGVSGSGVVSADVMLAAIGEARTKNAPSAFISALMAQAVANGATIDQVLDAAAGKPVNASPTAPADKGTATRQSSDKPATNTTPPASAVTPDEDEQVEVFAPVADDTDAERASAETVDSLKSLVSEAEITDMSLVSGILNYTFGTGVARNVSEENLGDFVDFYVANGADNFRAAMKKVAKG